MELEENNLMETLSLEEAAWWEKTIKDFRNFMIKEPKFYARSILEQKKITKESLIENIESIIPETREEIWQMYLVDEREFHTKVISYLVENRNLPKDVLKSFIGKELSVTDTTTLSKEKITEILARIVGNYSGVIMPYIYVLSLSTTQSRRSRAGKTFEHLMETCLELLDIPFENQSAIGSSFYRENNLGKKVDLIIPGADGYIKNRAKCAIVTMKTTLRERWQEVAEELHRTNIPHIYLLTIDDGLTSNMVTTMNQYNITVVLYKKEKDTKFASFENVKDFRTFFTKEIPYIVNYWKENNAKEI